MKPKVLFTDGEGPIVFKDLAADIMEKTVPGLFPILSFYDDYLAEVGTDGYQAGDTLALIAPHLLAHDIRDQDIANEAKDAKVCFGVEEYIAELKRGGWNIRIISTAYSQLWELVGKHIDVPMEDIACTTLNLKTLSDRFGNREGFKREILRWETEFPVIIPMVHKAVDEVNVGRSVVEVFEDPQFEPLKSALDVFYWEKLKCMWDYHVLNEVQVMGGRRKIEAAQRFANELDVNLADVAYVGDSITDDALHQRLSQEGGLPIAINGNQYALRNARVAVATKDMRHIRPVLDAWQQGGFEEVRNFIRMNGTSFLKTKEGIPISEEVLGPRYDLIDRSDPDGFQKILDAHSKSRRLVRGAATARLG